MRNPWWFVKRLGIGKLRIMKILADQDIPYLQTCFSQFGEIVTKPGRAISHADCQDIDVLLVRSITPVNKTLLNKTAVKFVGTLTSGDDHLDKTFLNVVGMPFATAKGANAPAVVHYVLSVIAALQNRGILSEKPCVGIVGVGCVGALLARVLVQIGCEVLLNDPPRAVVDKTFVSTPLSALQKADLVCVHAALTYQGNYPSFHLIDAGFIQGLRPGGVVLNAARGELVDSLAIKSYGQHLHWCCDVWENEPDIDPVIINQAVIATPHIAGYSAESKFRANLMIATEISQYFDLQYKTPNLLEEIKSISTFTNQCWQGTIRHYVDLLKVTSTFKNQCKEVGAFDRLRQQSNQRREVFDF